MAVLNLRDPRVLLWMLGLFAFLAVSFGIGTSLQESHHSMDLISSTWGNHPGEFGSAEARDGRRYGPPSFAVGRHMYVVDGFNSRIQTFDRQGKLVKILPLEAAPGEQPLFTDIAVDRAGNAYLVDARAREIRVVDPDGRRRFSFRPVEVKGGEIASLGSIAVDEGGRVYLATYLITGELYQWELGVYSPEGTKVGTIVSTAFDKSAEPRGTHTPGLGYAIGPGGVVYCEVRDRPFHTRLMLYAQGRLVGELRLPEVRYSGDSRFVGIDGRGRIYVAYDARLSKGYVARYSKDGKLLSEVPLEIPGDSWPNVVIRVDREGNLYAAWSEDAGYRIRTYRRRTRIKLKISSS